MRKKANERPYRGGKSRRWRENQRYRNWRAAVCNKWNNECAITGIKNSEDEQAERVLVAHHLVSASSSEDLAYNPSNGILIHKEIHKAFHLNFGYRNNTVGQFKEFIRRLLSNEIRVLISSQANLERLEGSETTVLNPARISKLHEYLDEIEKILT